jgi:hypothetical protein
MRSPGQRPNVLVLLRQRHLNFEIAADLPDDGIAAIPVEPVAEVSTETAAAILGRLELLDVLKDVLMESRVLACFDPSGLIDFGSSLI